MGATRSLTRSLLSLTRSYSSISIATPSSSLLRPLSAAASHFRHLTPPPSTTTRCFSTSHATSSLNDPNPNFSNRPPKETILLDGCDFEHWLVVVEKPEGDLTRDDIIDSYIKTLAQVVGSEEEARMKIYSVSTRHYFAFGALVSEELSYKLKELPMVRWVLPDSYLDVRNKDYGGCPYDPKYHEEWVRNNARANERNRRNDRPRNFDRSRNFERRNMQPNQNLPNSGPNMIASPQGNMGPNMAGGSQGNMGPNMAGGPPRNMGPNMTGGPPGNMGPNMAGGPPRNMGPNMGGFPPNNVGHQNPGPNFAGGPPSAPPNMGGMQPQIGAMESNNIGNPVNPPNYGAGSNNMGGYPNNQQNFNYGNVPNNGVPYQSGPNPNQNFAPNGGNPYQNQNMPGRDY